MRKEKDTLGEIFVPTDKYFGAQTQRASENFKIGNEFFPIEMIRAHTVVKLSLIHISEPTRPY